ncbi:MAG: putative zinc-binding protein [Phycisphaerales bacterium]
MSAQQSCGCGGVKLIFACCGAADVGEIADKAARKLTREGVGRMFCTAGLGGRISGILKTAEGADSILAIDGCPLNCVKSSLEQAGFSTFKHLRLVDLGLEKGKSPASEESVNKVAARAREMICT